MDTPPGRPAAPTQATPSAPEPRQRWRLTFARAAADSGDAPTGRDYLALWEKALTESGLAVATTDAGRPRFALAAPLPARTAGRAELADIWLTERVAVWQVREALDGVLPPDHELAALEDVWLGAPALAGRVAAADYAVTIGGRVDAAAMVAAADRLLSADRLVRERAKGGGVKTYDLRPLLRAIETAIGPPANSGAAAGGGERPCIVRIRTRIHPELGSGRPEEVIAALGEELGAPLVPVSMARERLVLSDDVDAPHD